MTVKIGEKFLCIKSFRKFKKGQDYIIYDFLTDGNRLWFKDTSTGMSVSTLEEHFISQKQLLNKKLKKIKCII